MLACATRIRLNNKCQQRITRPRPQPVKRLSPQPNGRFTVHHRLPCYSIPTRRFYSIARYGQPHPSTHPHLLKPGEVVIGITKEEFAQRRATFAKSLPPNSVAIFPAAQHYMMSNDIPYVYRQNTDLYYLCGINEPESVLVIENRTDPPYATLFVRQRDPSKELWDGPRTGVERAGEFFGVNEVYSVADVAKVLPTILARNDTDNIFVNDIATDVDALHSILTTLGKPVQLTTPIMERQRLIKSPAEIELMKKTCSISAQSFVEVMKFARPGMIERQLEAKMEFECRMRGALRLAYPPVVASGINNLTLHYVDNDSIIQDGDLVLIDAGCEYNNYSADITRTFPISGKFTKPQLDIYNATLRVQKEICSLVRTHHNGSPLSIKKLHRFSIYIMCEELIRLGLMSPSTMNDYFRFYPHSIGHYLGMDVHDTASISYDEPLKPGMIITVEPGIYVPNTEDIPEPYRGIGVRIEDDVLVTDGAPVVLTHEVPKDPDEIERIIQAARQ